jgi:multidrug efflux pump
MSFTDIFIERPVFSWVLSSLLLLFGLMSYNQLTLRQFPEISTTTVSVTTAYPGASAELMEGFVTAPLESAIAGVNGIDYITANNSKGISSIIINFKLGTDINIAASEVSDRVSSVRYRLPKEVFNSIIEKQNPNTTPTMYLSFASNQISGEEITDYLKRVVKPRLEGLSGVGEAKILGPRDYAMRIWLNPDLMASHNVTSTDVITALRSNNFQAPSGQISSEFQEYDVTATTDLTTAHQFNRMIVGSDNGHLTRIEDIGKAELGTYNPRASVTMNGVKSIVIGIITRGDANPLEVAAQVRATLPRMAQNMPGDLKPEVIWDSSKFIAASIWEVKKTIVEATVFVVLVMFIFLGSVRTLTIPLVTIPLSLIGIFSLMLLMGYSLNTITFLAMVLAIGLVVDDAIVVAENIHRHVEAGKTPLEAALIGTREIKFAIIAMTITLAAVFSPIGFRGGLTGSLFKEFAFTLAGTVIVSGFIALTLSPMMCSRIMTPKSLEGNFAKRVNAYFLRLEERYRKRLSKTIANRRLFLMIVLPLTLTISTLLAAQLFANQILAPQEDSGAILTIVQGPTGATLSFMEKQTQELAKILEKVPEKEAIGIINGFMGENSAISFLILKPWGERSRSLGEIIGSLFPQYTSITGANAFPINPYSLPGSRSLQPVGFVIQTTGSYDELYAASQKLIEASSHYPGLVNVSSDLKIDKPEIQINVDRDLAGNLGIPMLQFADAINFAFNESAVSQFSMNGLSYDVVPQVLPQYRQNPQNVYGLYVRTAQQNLVPMANLVHISERTTPQSLNHFQQMRAATISASIAPGYTQSQVINFLEHQSAKLLKENMRYDFSGESRQFLNESHGFIVILGFAILFILLILAAQFESFIDPLIVMVAVPLSIMGAFLLLIPFGGEVSFIGKCFMAFFAMKTGGLSAGLGVFKQFSGTLNIYTWIGILTLIGLVSKHGILIVEFANQLRAQGKGITESVIEAAGIRLRPILMTTAAIVLGATPLVFAGGAGAISRKEIGLVIIGGMLFGTLMSLFVVPIFYTLLAPFKKSNRAIP